MSEGTWKVSRRAWDWSVRLHRGSRNPKANAIVRWAGAVTIRRAVANDWFALLEKPEMRPFVEANPRLAFRPMGVYLSIDWEWERRAKVIVDSYEFIHAHGGALEEALKAREGRILARFPVGQGAEGWIRFGIDNQLRREGEVAVQLECSLFPGYISKIALAFERHPERGWITYIGAIQGRQADEEAIKALTKGLHGFRPKAFMVFLAQEIARSLRMRELLGVGNGIHVLRSRNQGLAGPRKRIPFDYDELWAEVDAEPGPEGWFRLPARANRREVAEMKPNKRSMYNKRYALMDDISRQIRTILTPFPRG